MSLVLVLSLLVGEPAPQDPQARALELYDQGRFAEAAMEFEALATQGDPKQFFEAGQMRFAAGHMAHASRHFQEYIASGLDEEQRSIAQSRLMKATTGTRRVEARVTPDGAATEVVARRVGDPPEQQRPELSTPVVAGTATLRLDPAPVTGTAPSALLTTIRVPTAFAIAEQIQGRQEVTYQCDGVAFWTGATALAHGGDALRLGPTIQRLDDERQRWFIGAGIPMC